MGRYIDADPRNSSINDFNPYNNGNRALRLSQFHISIIKLRFLSFKVSIKLSNCLTKLYLCIKLFRKRCKTAANLGILWRFHLWKLITNYDCCINSFKINLQRRNQSGRWGWNQLSRFQCSISIMRRRKLRNLPRHSLLKVKYILLLD